MIVRVLECAQQAQCTSFVAAVDDPRVLQAVEEAGFRAVMTDTHHVSGSDRVMEVAAQCGWQDDEIVINVQGDEPLIPPSLIDRLITTFNDDPSVEIATLREPLASPDQVMDPNVVKVVCSKAGDALYFSRAAIPFDRDTKEVVDHYRHIGLYGFRVGSLRRVTQYELGELESRERLEQLRWLENGERIRVATAPEAVPGGVDTAEDLQRVVAAFQNE